MQTYTPSEAVAQSGFTIETLRYYERAGLLGDIARDSRGRRAFSAADLAWLGMLRCLRDTGMPISQLRRYAELTLTNNDDSRAERLALLEEHDRAVEAKINLLHDQQAQVREKISYYRSLG